MRVLHSGVFIFHGKLEDMHVCKPSDGVFTSWATTHPDENAPRRLGNAANVVFGGKAARVGDQTPDNGNEAACVQTFPALLFPTSSTNLCFSFWEVNSRVPVLGLKITLGLKFLIPPFPPLCPPPFSIWCFSNPSTSSSFFLFFNSLCPQSPHVFQVQQEKFWFKFGSCFAQTLNELSSSSSPSCFSLKTVERKSFKLSPDDSYSFFQWP